MADQTAIERLRAGGIVSPQVVIAEARAAGLALEYAAALLEKETAGGHNVFGHDRDRSGRYIFPARDGTVKVTRELYREYKKHRATSGVCQGVGPCQLTSKFLQDRADAEGGCWKPQINMRVGFRHLVDLMRANGEAVGVRMYNGSGDAAEAYSVDVRKKAASWRARLGGAAGPVPAAGKADRLLRVGDDGPRVERMTRRLARLRSKRTGAPYLARSRSTFDSTVEAGLRAFQAEHRLETDGVYGPVSQRKLNRALRLQQNRKPAEKPGAPVPAEQPVAKRPRVTMKSLVGQLHRLDAETGEAWDKVVIAAAKRRRLLVRLQGNGAAAAGGTAQLDAAVAQGFEAVTAALQEIDSTLDTLVALETAEAASDAAERAAETAVATAAVPVATGAGPASGTTGPETTGPGGMTVTEMAPPPQPPPEGPAPPSPAALAPPPPPRRALTELTDEELLKRIERLDHALDRSRAVLIKRYGDVEREIARVAPKRAEPSPRPHENGKVRDKAPTKPEPHRPTRPRTMSKGQVKELQTALNTFTDRTLKSFGDVIVDGEKGPATKKRIREAKFYLGYSAAERRSSKVDEEFLKRLRKPRSARLSNPAMLTRALRRRRKQHKVAKKSLSVTSGVATFDGKPVAAWMKPYLDWARDHGWDGTLISGYRDPAHSEQVCIQKCGAPTCPGNCAGRSSNHAGSVKPAGALDVSDYVKFGQLMARCPLEPKLKNALGARDPNHFSYSGR